MRTLTTRPRNNALLPPRPCPKHSRRGMSFRTVSRPIQESDTAYGTKRTAPRPRHISHVAVNWVAEGFNACRFHRICSDNPSDYCHQRAVTSVSGLGSSPLIGSTSYLNKVSTMADLPVQVAVALSGSAFLLFILYTAAYRPVIFVGFLFVIFSLVWRTAATAFIDLAGPVWSSQTLEYIRPGFATPLHVLAYFITLIPFLILLRSRLIEGWLDAADNRPASPGTLDIVGSYGRGRSYLPRIACSSIWPVTEQSRCSTTSNASSTQHNMRARSTDGWSGTAILSVSGGESCLRLSASEIGGLTSATLD